MVRQTARQGGNRLEKTATLHLPGDVHKVRKGPGPKELCEVCEMGSNGGIIGRSRGSLDLYIHEAKCILMTIRVLYVQNLIRLYHIQYPRCFTSTLRCSRVIQNPYSTLDPWVTCKLAGDGKVLGEFGNTILPRQSITPSIHQVMRLMH